MVVSVSPVVLVSGRMHVCGATRVLRRIFYVSRRASLAAIVSSMKNILVIQSRSRKEMIEAEQSEYRRALRDPAVSFISTLDDTRAWNDPAAMLNSVDGVIIGGSGEFDLDGGRSHDDPACVTARRILERLRPLVEYALAENVPLLGICLGHQYMADMSGGSVSNDISQKKTGTFSVTLTNEGKGDPLFSLLPEAFLAQYGHKDSVTKLPKGGVVLASSPQCAFSALRYGEKAYSVQFHPELTAGDVLWKIEHTPGYLPENSDVQSLVKESPEASRLLPLFVSKIVSAA